MATARTNRQALGEIPQMVAGLKKHFAGQTLRFGGAQTTTADVIAVLEPYVAALNAVAIARARWLDAISKVQQQKPRVRPLLVNLQAMLRVIYGANQSSLGDFGMKPRPSRKKSIATKRDAIGKAAETRKARGTMGKKQKAKIKGTTKPPQ